MRRRLSVGLKGLLAVVVAGLLLAAALVFGYVLGRLAAAPGADRDDAAVRARRAALREVAEAYEPSCAELEKLGLTTVLERGETNLLLFVTADRFEVVGLDLRPGKPMVSYTWGAGRAYALESCR